MGETAGVIVEDVVKRYPGSERKALAGVSLTVEPGSFFSVLGPSGCGKTTLLRVLAGFERPTSGRVVIGGVDVTDIPPRERDIAMVFQDYALYPHMTVRQNITFNLRNRRVASSEIERRLSETATMLGIEGHLGKLPGQLSGGERQRVALGRALIRKPRVFLMDEPLSNLDLKLRETMRLELGRLHQRLGITIVFVTHDQAEAMTLSTKIAIMCDGQLQQVDRPDVVYGRPANTFVAKFIGSPSMNLFRGTYADGSVRLAGNDGVSIPITAGSGLRNGQAVIVGARPHEVHFAEPGPGRLPVKIGFTERLGRNNFVVCAPVVGTDCLAEGEAIQVETPSNDVHVVDGIAGLAFDAGAIKLFDESGSAVLPSMNRNLA